MAVFIENTNWEEVIGWHRTSVEVNGHYEKLTAELYYY